MFGLGLDWATLRSRGGGSGTVQAPPAVTRPPFAMAQAWNLWGDSTKVGVGAPGGSDYPQALRTMAAAGGGAPAGVACHLGAPSDGTRTGVCNGGVAGENMASIAGRVATLARSRRRCSGRRSSPAGSTTTIAAWPDCRPIGRRR